MSTSAVITLEPNGTVTRRRYRALGVCPDNDFTVVLDGVTYRGVFTTQWDDDHGAWVYAFSAISRDGVAAWGSQTVVAKHPPRRVALRGREPLYGQTFSLPDAHARRKPVGLLQLLGRQRAHRVDRGSRHRCGDVAAGPVGRGHSVRGDDSRAQDRSPVIRTRPGTPSPSPPRRPRSSGAWIWGSRPRRPRGCATSNGLFTGFTTRLPGTGAALPELDPDLRLDRSGSLLALAHDAGRLQRRRAASTRNSSPGVALADLGFTGGEDFAVTVVFRPLAGLEFIDQVGLYVGASSGALTRAGTIVFGAPERYSVHSENGADHSGRFFGFGLDAQRRDDGDDHQGAGAWRYTVDGVEWNPQAPPAFLDGLADLTAGVFAVTPPQRQPGQEHRDRFVLAGRGYFGAGPLTAPVDLELFATLACAGASQTSVRASDSELDTRSVPWRTSWAVALPIDSNRPWMGSAVRPGWKPTQALRPLALATYSARSATLITCSQLSASSCSRKNG